MSIHAKLIEVRALKKSKKYADCIRILSPLFEEAVTSKQVDPDLVRSLAEAFYLSGDFSRGQKLYVQAISAGSGSAILVGRYGEYLAFSGFITKGLSFIDKALQLAPSNDHLALSKGIILHRYLKDLDAAAAFLQNYMNNKSDNCDPDLYNEFNAVMHKIEKRKSPISDKTTKSIWDTLPTRQAVSTQNAISASYSGMVKHKPS